jgi:bifunctional DNase/RNase
MMRPVVRAIYSITILSAAILIASCALISCVGGKRAVTPAGEVRTEVTNAGFDRSSGVHYVLLENRAERRSLQIMIGQDEAREIMLQLHGIKSARPLTNELLRTVIERTGNKVDRVEVTEVHDEVYYAKIVLDHGRYTIDSRPSDAIALAMSVRAPIYVARALMQSVSASEVPALSTSANFGVTVQKLTPDLAEYFGVEPDSGVVVADLGAEAVKAGLERGDIVIEIGGHAIRSPGDFAQAAAPPSGAPVALTIRRDSATRIIKITPPITPGATH